MTFLPGRDPQLYGRGGAREEARPHVRRFDAHPWLDAFAPLWTSGSRRRPHQPPLAATQEIQSRARRALEADEVIGTALARVTWRQLSRLPASASRQRLLFHKIKGLRLSGYDRIARHQTSQASRTVAIATTPSGTVGSEFADDTPSFCAAVFSLRLNHTPPAAWTLLHGRQLPDDLIPIVHDVVTTVWQQQVLGCLYCIWQWRNSIADPDFPWTAAVARSALTGALRSAYTQVQGLPALRGEHREALRHLLHGLSGLQLQHPQPGRCAVGHATDRYLLFFDGGSRGNPGPGGAGAVIVRVDAHGGGPELLWVASMSLANKTTTNNQAEYTGLVTGLRLASQHRLRPLSVIGDSAMIIAQLKNQRPPKHPRLRSLYGQARVLADGLAVTEWRHHVRAYNTMADHAANAAMDSRRSVQLQHPTAHHTWAALQTHLHDDVSRWQATTYQGLASIG